MSAPCWQTALRTRCTPARGWKARKSPANATGTWERLSFKSKTSMPGRPTLWTACQKASVPARDWGKKAWSRLRNPAAVGRTSPLKTAWLPCRRYSKTRSKDCFKGCSLRRAPEPELEKFLRDKVKSAQRRIRESTGRKYGADLLPCRLYGWKQCAETLQPLKTTAFHHYPYTGRKRIVYVDHIAKDQENRSGDE